jgi:uncharacterized membrane protein
MRTGTRWVLAVLMVVVGILHFVNPEPFVMIVPDYLPWPLALVWISGVFEIAGGVGLLIEKTRRAASLGLIALYVAVFPANVWMATEGIQPPGMELEPFWAWARLPLQAVLIALAWWVGRPEPCPIETRA